MKPIQPKLYDKLKFLAQIGLPAAGTLYASLAAIWGFGAIEEVTGTVLALDTFLGVVLQLSSTAYANSEERFDGAMVNHGEGVFSLQTGLTGNELEEKTEVVLQVTDAPLIDEELPAPKPRAKRKPKAKPSP